MVALRFRILLVAAALLAFCGALGAPFQFDDFSLLNDPALNSAHGWNHVFTATQTRPLTFLSFWVNLQISDAPWTFHLVSLVLHLACVWLASGLLLELLPLRAAWLASAVFAFHPLQTEAVAYVFSRATLLAALFCLLSLSCWLKGRRWWAFGLFVCGLLAKEEVAAFPLFLALLEWSTRRSKAAVGPIAAMCAAALAAGLRTIYATSMIAGSGAGTQAGLTSFDYFSYQGVAILRYLQLLLVPIGFTVDAEVRVPPLAAALAWGVIVVVAILAWRTVRAAQPGFWVLGGLLLLLPSSSIFPAEDLAVDRRMYLPLFCFAALFGMLLQKANQKLLYGYAALLLVLSFAQTRVWMSPEALWMEAARHAPSKIRPKRQLARVVQPAQAVELMEEAKRLAPEDAAVATDLGLSYLRANKPEVALGEFGRALALDPNSAMAIHNRGMALLLLGQADAAKGDFARALEKDPCLFDAHWNLRRLGVVRTMPSGCAWTRRQAELLQRPEISSAP
ncbi:tetratricopeptide repeat protein [Paludibaculum fermentans]|uniref:Tetratricopeptide repeat protein n=1 Tax=Paludibaculum fermentans TaxID=1473598 RepID=A0A7S7NWL2_PALFE|nr:tetratricopeptide repeat protein [Paludibaculum fermentans]QOY91130.1 tetratricopeptide repeat protein [Paludibaculum fermentans]